MHFERDHDQQRRHRAVYLGLARGNVRIAITILFIGAMLLLTLGLMFFLREIYLSTRYLRIGEPEPEHSPGRGDRRHRGCWSILITFRLAYP